MKQPERIEMYYLKTRIRSTRTRAAIPLGQPIGPFINKMQILDFAKRLGLEVINADMGPEDMLLRGQESDSRIHVIRDTAYPVKDLEFLPATLTNPATITFQ